MELEQIDSAHSNSGVDAQTIPTDRETQLNQLFITNCQTLREQAYQTYPALLVWDCGAILGSLSQNLSRYTGPSEQAPFLKWANRFVIKEAQRYNTTAEILSEHGKLIHSAICHCLWKSTVDASVEHQDIYWEVAFLIFQRAHNLARKGTAKLTTRLWALVEKHCYLYHNSKNHRRRTLVQQFSESIKCERLTEEEIAAERASDELASSYDPGYAECGLSIM